MTSQITLSYFDRPTKKFDIPPLDSIFAELVYRADQRRDPALGQQAYYQFYYLRGKYFAAGRILGIGSVDLQCYKNPFGVPSQQVARDNFHRCCPGVRAEFVKGNSHAIAFPVSDLFDLIHIDGDHSANGCRDDIIKFWPHLAPDGVMLVDDLDQGSVRNGYAQATSAIAATSAFFPTKHGLGMLFKAL